VVDKIKLVIVRKFGDLLKKKYLKNIDQIASLDILLNTCKFVKKILNTCKLY